MKNKLWNISNILTGQAFNLTLVMQYYKNYNTGSKVLIRNCDINSKLPIPVLTHAQILHRTSTQELKS